MSAERLNSGPQEQKEVKDFLSDYEGIYEQSQARVDQLTNAQARTQLGDFLKKNDFQLPQEQQEIMKNEEQMRFFLALGLAEQQLKPIRAKILQKIDNDMQGAPAKDQYAILRSHFDKIAAEKPNDVLLLNDLLSRLIGAETIDLREKYNEASQKPLIDSGKNWLQNGGEKPSEFNNNVVPQLAIFSSFRVNIFQQEKFKDLRVQFGREVNSVEEFVEETFVEYLDFIKSNNIDKDQFCPSKEFYMKLCAASGMSSEMFSGIDTSAVATSANFTEFSASQTKNESFFKERETFHEQEQERLESQVTQLKAESEKQREQGNTTKATEIDLRVLELEGEAKNHETKAEEFDGLIDASKEVTSLYEREVMSTEGARALFSNNDYLGNLAGTDGIIGSARGYAGKFFAATSRGMDWVGRQVPDTGDPMSWNVGSMLTGVMKTGLAAGGIINLIKGFAPAYMGFHKAVGTMANPLNWFRPSKWKSSVSGLWDGAKGSLNEVGNFATAAGTFAAVKYGSVEGLEKGVSWVLDQAGTGVRALANSIAPEYGHKIKEMAAYVSENAKPSFENYVLNPSINIVSEVATWPGELWDLCGKLFNMTDESIAPYREFFGSMDSTEKDLKQEFATNPQLKNLGMNIDIQNLSSDSFGEMCQSYSSQNLNHDRTKGVMPISLEELAKGGFLYENGKMITVDKLRENSKYISLPKEQRVVSISSETSATLVKQADFWLRKYPSDSKRRAQLTPTN